MPNVSVIVPVYNVEEYLNRCIESILEQSYQDFELILVDDESPDNCGAMCDTWAEKDRRVRVIHKKNGGVSAARNAGLDIAQGKYIAFCDSDDYWEKDFLQVLVGTAEEKKYDITACGFLHRKPKKDIECLKKKYEIGFCNSLERVDYLHRRFLKCDDGWEVCCRLFRADLIQKHNIRFCTDCGNFAEDLGFTVKCIMQANLIGAVGECLYNYVWRPSSMMSSSTDLIRLDNMNQVSAYLQECYSPRILGKHWRKYCAVSHYMIMYNQYIKIFQQERQCELPEMLRTITNVKWFRKNNIALLGSYGLLKEYFGKKDGKRIWLFSTYCLHRCWFLYRIMRGVYNRFHRGHRG